jgi:integrase
LRQSKNPVDVVDGFIEHLDAGKKLSPVSIKSLFYGVKKWLETNQVSLDWNLVSRPKVSSRIRDRCPTRDELRRIFTGTTLRDKALFLTCTCSGLRIGTAIRLQVKDVQWLKELDVGIVNVEGGEGRKLGKGNWYHTFITGEAWNAIQDYLASRKNTSPDEPLFAASTMEQGFYRYSNNVTRQWRKLCRRAGLSKKIDGHTWTELHTHVLRKYFQTSCKIAGISPSYYDFWMGHISTRTETNMDDSYFRAQLKRHVDEYKKALKDLTILEDISKNEELQDLKVVVDSLRRQVESGESSRDMHRNVAAYKSQEMRDFKNAFVEAVRKGKLSEFAESISKEAEMEDHAINEIKNDQRPEPTREELERFMEANRRYLEPKSRKLLEQADKRKAMKR